MKYFFTLLFIMAQLAGLNSVLANDTGEEQATIHEIVSVIKNSMVYNYAEGVMNPDLIYPGQTLHFEFEDGHIHDYTVVEGDNQWNVVTFLLNDLIRIHGPVKPEVEKTVTIINKEELEVPPTSFWDNPSNLGLLLALLMALLILYFWIRSERRQKQQKHQMEEERLERELQEDYPVFDGPNEGNPVREDGLPVDDARAHFEQRLQNSGYQHFDILEIDRGVLNGRGKVTFAGDRKPEKRTLEDEPAYRCKVRHSDGTEETLYSLIICANDARTGLRYEGFEFTPDTVQPDVLTNPTSAGRITDQGNTAKAGAGQKAVIKINSTITEGEEVISQVNTELTIIGTEINDTIIKMVSQVNKPFVKRLAAKGNGNGPQAEPAEKEA